MRNEASIRQWASLVMEADVRSLAEVQNVRFTRELLHRIDPAYFPAPTTNDKNESYQQVLGSIGKYFKEEIGGDIRAHLEGVNVFKNPGEVWQLLLGVAIKGGNRNQNINIIFEMDPALQAELMEFVSQIIDKFGQGVAASKEAPLKESEAESSLDPNRVLLDLIDQHEQLRQKHEQVLAELQKQRKAAISARQQFQETLEHMRLEKQAFYEILIHSSILGSRVFEEDDDSFLDPKASLAELGRDLVSMIVQQKKNLNKTQERALQLEEALHESRREARRFADESEAYLSQMGDAARYEKQIQILREEKAELLANEAELLNRIADIEEQKYMLVVRSLEKNQNMSPTQSVPSSIQRSSVRAKRQAEQSLAPSQANGESEFIPSYGQRLLSQQQKNNGMTVRRQIDELREPILRNKLQREVSHLQNTIKQLQKQNDALRKANNALQRSMKQFMEDNHRVVKKWEGDYEQILKKMEQLIKKDSEKPKKSQSPKISISQSPKIQVSETPKILISQASKIQVQQPNQQQIDKQIEEIANSDSSSEIPSDTGGVAEIEEARRAQWTQAVTRMRQLMRQGKVKQMAYQSSIAQLKKENLDLLEKLTYNIQKQKSIQMKIIQDSPRRSQKSFLQKLGIQRQESLEFKQNGGKKHMKIAMQPQLMSYISLREGSELQDSSHTIRDRGKSNFFQLNSHAVDQIIERQQSILPPEQQQYARVTRRLDFSISESLNGIGSIIGQTAASEQLRKKLQRQIGEIEFQYGRLNIAYQQVFSQLNIYTDRLKQNENAKHEYGKFLEEVAKVQEEARITHEGEVAKLQIINAQLHSRLVQQSLWKQQILGALCRLEKEARVWTKQQSRDWGRLGVQLEELLGELREKCQQVLQGPATFLSTYLGQSNPGQEQSQIQKFYKLYLREQGKNKQLNEQLQILSGVLLQYRNILQQD